MASTTDEARLSPRYDACVAAPFAVLGIVTEGDALTGLHYLPVDTPLLEPRNRVASKVARELARYYDDAQFRFSVPIAPRGTAFQRRTWEAIGTIPIGESRTYAEVARTVRSSARPVGQACGANPIALVIPCHRVIGSCGSLGGFMNAASGSPLAIKRWLLTHEGYRFGA